MGWRGALLLIVLALIVACTSPEATRRRAGGMGGDVGNHGSMELHAGSKPYYGTPTSGPTLLPHPPGAPAAATNAK